ncbi:MAG: hypothetical protein HYR67_09310 [Bacteroidetes bacterium]|nr:hypothetical protein [Bacteroidota bacterium]
MKTIMLTLDESQEEVIKALAKALKLEIVELTEKDEDLGLTMAMEEGKKYGRMSEEESDSFLKKLGE